MSPWEVPRLLSAVTRTPTLSTLTDLFTESATTRNPTVAVLAGTTGFGKSTIAADFCHLNRHLYEHVFWIDARTPELLNAWATDRIAQMGIDVARCPDIGAALRTELARRSGPWVVVFDGAVRRSDIEPYLPTGGTGFVIITTTNSTGWWHTAHEIPISSFTDAEAIACFCAYGRIEPGTHTEVITDIVTRLGRVPLAIAMAASYFRNAGDDIAALSGHYFDSLAALDDDASIPDDFDNTAFAAVRFAVDQMAEGSSTDAELARESQLLLYHSAFFAPELIPVNLVLQTVQGSVIELDLASPPQPSEADRDVRNRILTRIRTQTVARRRSYLDATGAAHPTSDTITIHPLVHRILREIHLRAAPRDTDLMNLLTLFMGHLYGWFTTLRPTGQFFAVEQLLIHAEWLLDFVDETITVPEHAESRHAYVYRCAAFYLRHEVANCYSSRGDYARGITLLAKALDEFADVDATIHPQCAAAKAAGDAIVDIEAGGLGPQQALSFAQRTIDALHKIDRFTDQPRRGEVIYKIALPAAQALNRFATPETRRLAKQLADIAQRHQPSQPTEIDMYNYIDACLKNGQNQQALTLVQQIRGNRPTAYNAIMFDNFEIIANLHLHRFDVAITGIDRILAVAARDQHMRTHIELASQEIGAALTQTRPAWGAHTRRLASQETALRNLT